MLKKASLHFAHVNVLQLVILYDFSVFCEAGKGSSTRTTNYCVLPPQMLY